MPTWSLGLVTLGGLWLCIWRRPWRWFGLAGIGAGLVAMLTVEVPDLFIDGSGRLLAARTADGGLLVSSKSVGRSTREAWLRRTGSEAPAGYWPKQGASADGGLRCDASGCVYRVNEHIVAVAARGEALIEDCRLADVLISLVPVRGSCTSASALLDRFDLWREGAHAVWLDRNRVRIESVNGVRGDRPWVLRPRQTAGEEPDDDPDAVSNTPSRGGQ
jgi:competence protein ComEC